MQRAVSLSCRLFPGDRGSLLPLFSRDPGSLAAPHVVPELVGPPGNLEMCRRQPSTRAAELEAASQPASEVMQAQGRHRGSVLLAGAQVLRHCR